MSEETVALIYKFLSDNDQTFAEMFKRQFNPNLDSIKDLPALEEIVQNHIQAKKAKITKQISTEIPCRSKIESMINAVKSDPCSFLKKIVNKRINNENCSETDSDIDDEVTPLKESSSSDEKQCVSAPKRKRLSSGSQKIWNEKPLKNKSSKNQSSEKLQKTKPSGKAQKKNKML